MAVAELSDCSSEQLCELAGEITAALRKLEGYLAQVACAARVLDDAGSGSAVADVMRSGGEVSSRRAKKLAARAHVGARLPAVGQALAQGAARGENVDSIARRTAALSDGEIERLASQDEEVASRASSLPPETFDRYLSDVIGRVADEPDSGPSVAEQQRAASVFAMGRQRNGMWWLRGSLDGERGAEINALITAAASEFAGDGSVNDNQRAAALHQLVNSSSGDGARSRMAVGYIVDAKTLAVGPHPNSVAQTWGGDRIEAAAAARLACDADCYAVLIDQLGQPQSVGRTRRTATREQRLQLRALYRGCPIDGTPFDRCDIHHVNVPWGDGGETELHNLLPISLDWHHRIHDRGWTLKMAPDRALKLWRPDGTLERSIPPPTPITRE